MADGSLLSKDQNLPPMRSCLVTTNLKPSLAVILILVGEISSTLMQGISASLAIVIVVFLFLYVVRIIARIERVIGAWEILVITGAGEDHRTPPAH
jgi:hypothetical protein